MHVAEGRKKRSAWNLFELHDGGWEGCTKKLQLGCNHPETLEKPFGWWIVSICPAYCDTTRAMCFCGAGTKYPNRPVAESCGFKINLPSEPGGPKITDWTKADFENIFTTNSSRRGWCNVDPKDAYASKVNFKEECDCKYDGLGGRFCEIPTVCSCLNQCSGHGHCHGGFCQCDNGYYGIDCSIPSALSPMQEWPAWLRPSKVDVPDKAPIGTNLINVSAVVKKKRPLIYVYDLPPEFNSHLLEGRHWKFECVNRIYTDENRTLWTEQLYGSQMALYESILASPYRTMNGEEADYFYVPVLDSCLITRADDAPHLGIQKHSRLRSSVTLDFYKKAYDHIVDQYLYWNRSSGRDHIWFFSWDEGACCAPKEIWNSMMLVHWGNTNSKHNHSTTAYWADNWDPIPSHRRGDHPCFDPEKDLVLPAWKRPEPGAIWLKLWARPRKERKTLFYFNGNLGSAYEHGRPENTYSMGIRQKLAEEFGSTPNKEGKLGRQHAANVTVSPLRSPKYLEELASSLFCGVLPGDGWSGRMEDSIQQGCIPVIIQDGIFLPYENVLNYKSFAVRIQEDDIPNLIKILQGINETEIEFMLANVRQIWQRFLYRDSVLLEAQRQKKLFPEEDGWAVEFSKLREDDVFSTFIQVLHYKLHNDPWRQHLSQPKESGLPKVCLRTH
ncbi:probable glucuronoxylan glucuronosyltransferase F8H isoform X7 [Elaeis guineensis]|uniref:probable glucuronoxylan glucuronosyltransferase F8H isoform X7 n=1 Tax=Elaeis guineensis var. tenera TaxID=51953 RepID=UPI00094FE4E1